VLNYQNWSIVFAGSATGSHRNRSSDENLLYDGASEVVLREFAHIQEWRGLPGDPQVGFALSGGGIRSASFCLGVLQALAHKRALPSFDYLSTVSGGGYIGASLTYLLHQSAHDPERGLAGELPRLGNADCGTSCRRPDPDHTRRSARYGPCWVVLAECDAVGRVWLHSINSVLGPTQRCLQLRKSHYIGVFRL
jgi:hypothetical protein